MNTSPIITILGILFLFFSIFALMGAFQLKLNEIYIFAGMFIWALLGFMILGFAEAIEYLKNISEIMKKIDKRLGK